MITAKEAWDARPPLTIEEVEMRIKDSMKEHIDCCFWLRDLSVEVITMLEQNGFNVAFENADGAQWRVNWIDPVIGGMEVKT